MSEVTQLREMLGRSLDAHREAVTERDALKEQNRQLERELAELRKPLTAANLNKVFTEALERKAASGFAEDPEK